MSQQHVAFSSFRNGECKKIKFCYDIHGKVLTGDITLIENQLSKKGWNERNVKKKGYTLPWLVWRTSISALLYIIICMLLFKNAFTEILGSSHPNSMFHFSISVQLFFNPWIGFKLKKLLWIFLYFTN